MENNLLLAVFVLLAASVALVPLIITYLLEVYGSLRARNSRGLKVHLHSAETGDAAELIAALGPRGRFDAGYIILAEWAAETVEVKEWKGAEPAGEADQKSIQLSNEKYGNK